MFYHLFSHSEDLHEPTTAELEHSITEPVIAIPLFLVTLLAIYLICTRILHLKKTTLSIVFLGFLLLAGVGLYTLVPIISFFSLSVGIGLALFFVLGTLLAK